ncbi:hypothetical protein G7A66_00590 [Altererythrobacter sp. SALINAS58]|uniref:hypothetical protein n=1 Tax=Alteripontixanthobacter muriae TaxID=2705546 RepID=UPI0015759AAF|nr:hypothetical protein [Alteripontixanthobacter muriae]NTZ41610.1 hypothetical protein [Alteripontixanthobacter muriae]
MLAALVSTAVARDEHGRLLIVGNRTVVGHQIAAALALGCEHILCLVDGAEVQGNSVEVNALRQQATKGGAAFHLASDIFGVSAKVTAHDALIVFAAGLLPQHEVCRKVAAGRFGVAAYSSPGGESAPLERIDSDYVWGGIFRAPGDIVERFASVAPDGDPISGLLRTALQSGLRMVELADGEAPIVIRTSQQARAESERWRRQSLGKPDWRIPGEAIAVNLALRHGDATELHDRTSALSLAPFLLVGIGIVLAWAGWATLAFLALGAGFVVRLLPRQLARGSAEFGQETPATDYSILLFDAAVLTVSYFALQTAADPIPQPDLDGFAIIAAILVLPWLAIRYSIPLWQAAARDRLALCIGLAICAVSGSFAISAGILLIIILAAMLMFPRSPQLTRS